ncbi:complement component C1q receptor-like [Carassius carassius]|uniref:complement component C1q receptor-like n=1 Tax=Carassius carassius TaxID=217509 RepID=UPI0028684304|nr:complement component C1q receptor-like [Carassius carassius]
MGNRTVGKCCAAYPCLFFGLLYLYWYEGVIGQSLQEQNIMCNAEACYSIHLQRNNFLDSWRSCKYKGGNLATIKGPEEASMIHDLLSSGIRSHSQPKIRLWIGLQRQPRKCSVKSPLRGFTWITGDQETQYTNWQHDDLANGCAAHRCVFITYNTPKKRGNNNNFKWVHRSCVVAVEGFLCRYTYHGMCPALQKEGGGPAVYTTPFKLTSTVLTHIPIGSVATLPCPDGDKEDQSVMCMMREDGSVGWSKDAPLCTDTPIDWCKQDNGGCEHYCVNSDTHYYCECFENYVLKEDGKTCKLLDPCYSANCEFECESTPQGHRCKCPEGYLLSADNQSCLDIDECLLKPCQQECVNAPGTFECRCNEGFLPSEFGECVDVDECLLKPCQQECVNAPGTFECRCNEGFLLSEFGECVDVDECLQKPCQHECVNAPGTFECRCNEGFLPSEFGECVDVDECMEEKCVHICENLPGSYTCHCPDGFSPLKEDPEKCEDIDECKREICEQVCRNYNGGFECLCKEGYMLQEDKYLCRQVNENKSLTDSPTVEWHPTYLSWSTEKTEERDVTTQTSNSPSSNFLMYTTTSAHTHQGDAPKKEISIATGDKVDVRSLGNKRLSEASDSVTLTPPTSQISEYTLASKTIQPPDDRKKHDKSWLIVALLVILCVFAVVILALGIVYCTSWAVERRSKSVTDCHRWTTTSKPKKSITAKSRA